MGYLRCIALVVMCVVWFVGGMAFGLNSLANGSYMWLSPTSAIVMLCVGTPLFLWAVWQFVDHPPTALVLAAVGSSPFVAPLIAALLV